MVPARKGSAPTQLLADLRVLIDAGRTHVAQAVNAGMVLLYWSVGDRIGREVLGKRRAPYGEQILRTLSEELAAEYGRGFVARQKRIVIGGRDFYIDLVFYYRRLRRLIALDLKIG